MSDVEDNTVMANRQKIERFIRDNFPYGHPEFYSTMIDLMDLHNRKNRDYATKEDPLQNFNRVAKWCREYNLITPGNEALKVAIIYCLKQFDAALKLVKENQEGQVEGVPDRLKDVAVYTVIEMILYGEGKQ